MIERVFVKSYLSFEETEVWLDKGLIVFSGPSGAGKSIFFEALLGALGYKDVDARVIEVEINKDVDLDIYGIEKGEGIVFRYLKKKKGRYFINNQSVSKKLVYNISSDMILYLGTKSTKEFESSYLISYIDKSIKDERFWDLKLKYKTLFEKMSGIKKEIEELNRLEKEALEKREFIEFEIKKLKDINPQEEEFEELMELKKELSRLDKIKEKLEVIDQVFYFENDVIEFLSLVGRESDFFTSALNELRIIADEVLQRHNELSNVDVEEVLNRLGELNYLIKRFGSIKRAKEYLKEKEEELEKIESIDVRKETLLKELEEIEKELIYIASDISRYRKSAFREFESKFNEFLNLLGVKKGSVKFLTKEISKEGIDEVEILFEGVKADNLSSGELNRARLALMATNIKEDKIVILDEIDANLSGEESKRVAEVVKYISSYRQVLAISHQVHLASKADLHFLVTKENNKSFIKELDFDERIKEIMRIIGGESSLAKKYALEILKDNR